MFRNMTLGQYYPADSILHRLDPRVKLLFTLVYVITLFFPKSAAGMGLATFFLVFVIILSRVPLLMMMRGIKPLLWIILFSAIFNAVFTPGRAVLTCGPLHITIEGIRLAAYLVVRLIYLVLGSSLMTYTTTPGELTAGLETGLGFLNHFHVPVHEFAMMMSIALRFIPILTEELDKIMKAQMSRGVDFEEGNLFTKARKLVPILIPLFVSALRRASDLATAMEARCYHGGKGRTRLHPLRFKQADYIACGVIEIYLIFMVLIAFV